MNLNNSLFIKSAILLAHKTKSQALLLYIDALDDLSYDEPIPRGLKLILVTKKKKWNFDDDDKSSLHHRADGLIRIPKINLSRISLIKVAVLLSLTQELIQEGDQVVCLVGHGSFGHNDCIQLLDTAKERELLSDPGLVKMGETLSPEVFQAVLNLAIELADKGREGKSIGTIFVLGDEEKVMQFSKQMIINPFKGYDDDERNILNREMAETIREFASLDGAFIIGSDGVVLTAGRYLSASMDEGNLPPGLGSRHISAAGITALTEAVAFVISESSGDLRIFKGGKVLMEIEKPAAK